MRRIGTGQPGSVTVILSGCPATQPLWPKYMRNGPGRTERLVLRLLIRNSSRKAFDNEFADSECGKHDSKSDDALQNRFLCRSYLLIIAAGSHPFETAHQNDAKRHNTQKTQENADNTDNGFLETPCTKTQTFSVVQTEFFAGYRTDITAVSLPCSRKSLRANERGNHNT